VGHVHCTELECSTNVLTDNSLGGSTTINSICISRLMSTEGFTNTPQCTPDRFFFVYKKRRCGSIVLFCGSFLLSFVSMKLADC